MPNVPESELQHVFDRLIVATARNAPARKTAVRWFNRLYYDVRRWNEGFTAFLRSYPGFNNSVTPGDYKVFLTTLQNYRESLEERYGTVKNDLCTSLKILSARYPRDFGWLFKEDESTYHEIRSLIDDSYATEMGIIGIAYSVCNFIHQVSSDDEWHTRHRDEVVKRVREYEGSSLAAVSRLHDMANSAGIHLLEISEYDAILSNEGSANPNVMIIGEVTMSQDNINIHHVVGSINVKSRLDNVKQIVNNAPSAKEDQKQELTKLLEELKASLEGAASKAPEDSERVLQAAEMVAAEVSKQKPNKSFLTITAEGLKEAAKAVEAVAPSVLAVAGRIAAYLATAF